MVKDTTLHARNNAQLPPDHVILRSLSNKYVSVPLLKEGENNLLQSLKDFPIAPGNKQQQSSYKKRTNNQKNNIRQTWTTPQHQTMTLGMNHPPLTKTKMINMALAPTSMIPSILTKKLKATTTD
jgi:hypothetical protein